MKTAYFSACMGCILASAPFAPAFAQTPTSNNTASVVLNGADFTLQLLSGTGALNSGPFGSSWADTELNGTEQTVNSPNGSKSSDSSASTGTPYSLASASTQGYSATASSRAAQGAASSVSGYELSYTAAPGAVVELSIPYTIQLTGNSSGEAEIETVIYRPNGSRQDIFDQEAISSLGPAQSDSGYLDLIVRNTANAPQQYLFTVDASAGSSRLVSTVPEPQSYLMLLSGLAIVGGLACRRKSST